MRHANNAAILWAIKVVHHCKSWHVKTTYWHVKITSWHVKTTFWHVKTTSGHRGCNQDGQHALLELIDSRSIRPLAPWIVLVAQIMFSVFAGFRIYRRGPRWPSCSWLVVPVEPGWALTGSRCPSAHLCVLASLGFDLLRFSNPEDVVAPY
jgi:hypothetical protein